MKRIIQIEVETDKEYDIFASVFKDSTRLVIIEGKTGDIEMRVAEWGDFKVLLNVQDSNILSAAVRAIMLAYSMLIRSCRITWMRRQSSESLGNAPSTADH